MDNENKKKDLRKSIEKLHAEHDLLDERYKKKKQELKSFISDLEYHIDNPGNEDHLKMVSEKLPGLIKIFELKHPEITDVLNKISMILSNMGI